MPFVLRKVNPVLVSQSKTTQVTGNIDERELICNITLSSCLRQLACLVQFASEIFSEIHWESEKIHRKSTQLRGRLDQIILAVDSLDSRTVPVPEGDLAVFSAQHKTVHYTSQPIDKPPDHVPVLNLFGKENRPRAVESLYLSAMPSVTAVVRLNSDFDDADYQRLAALGATLRRRRRVNNQVLDIETRRPASLAHLREWLTDDEALDDVTAAVGPDNRHQITSKSCDGALHRLPSPEEKARVAAQVFAAEVIQLDVTGKGFDRMTQFRRSLMHVEYEIQPPERKRSGGRKRGTKKRRNTIACDDRREIQDAIAHTSPLTKASKERSSSRSSLRQRLNLVHLFRQSILATPSSKQSGSAVASSDLSYEEGDTVTQTETDATSHASSDSAPPPPLSTVQRGTDTLRPRRLGADHSFRSGLVQVGVQVHITDNVAVQSDDGPSVSKRDSIYEIIPSEKEFGTLGNARPVLRPVKLRSLKDNDGARSSSGNWSGSSSTRASLDSEHHSNSTNLSPPTIRHRLNRTCSNRSLDFDSALSDCSQSAPSKFPGISSHLRVPVSSQTSEGTLTPEVPETHVTSDVETSSVYSCDAEGYYTSFHIDSGLKTLREEHSDPNLLHSSCGLHVTISDASKSASGLSNGENEYELFGKGSTSTTTSSAGTVILRDSTSAEKRKSLTPPEPPPRNRDSIATVIHVSLDDQHGKSSMEREQIHPTLSDAESKEISSALNELKASEPTLSNGMDSYKKNHQCRVTNGMDGTESETESRERIKAKTQINVSRIPALCIVTPPPSDDESVRSASALESHIQSAFLQHVYGDSNSGTLGNHRSADVAKPTPRIDLTDCLPPVPVTDTPIVIKASVVKVPPGSKDGELVSLNELPKPEAEVAPFASNGNDGTAVSSSESSRSSSLERKRRQGARVTLDADGKVVYSSDSLRRRKGAHTSFEPGPHIRTDDGKGNRMESSAFRPVPIGLSVSPEFSKAPSKMADFSEWKKDPSESSITRQPPPYRPAPTIIRTQPDGDADVRPSAGSPSSVMVSRSDSYRLANEESSNNSPFQRNESYRMANQIRGMDVSRPSSMSSNRKSSSPGPNISKDNSRQLGPLNAGLNGRAVNGRRSSSPGVQLEQTRERFILPSPYQKAPNSVSTEQRIVLPGQDRTANCPGQYINKHLHDRSTRDWSNKGQVASNHSSDKEGTRYANRNLLNRQQHSTPALRGTEQQYGYHSLEYGGRYAVRQVSSPTLISSEQRGVSPGRNGTVNPNLMGRRTYGGPRVLVNPKLLPAGSSSSLNSSGSGIDLSMKAEPVKTPASRPVVRPPTTAQDRPSFYTSGLTSPESSHSSESYSQGSPIPGYQSLSPPPRMSALPLAVPGSDFNRSAYRYNSLPARLKQDPNSERKVRFLDNQPNYTKWLPGQRRSNDNNGRDSPEEGGFLEYNNNNTNKPSGLKSPAETPSVPVSSYHPEGDSHFRSSNYINPSPTPSSSSCSLDISFSSSITDPLDPKPLTAWPPQFARPSSQSSSETNYTAPRNIIRKTSDPGIPSKNLTIPEFNRHSGSRHSWSAGTPFSPGDQNAHQSAAINLSNPTTITDFKRKLLLHTKPNPDQRISAVELLKATKPPPKSITDSPAPGTVLSPVSTSPNLENMIRRSTRVSYIANRLNSRRYNSPRTDVLSSTIVEGRSEEELADSQPHHRPVNDQPVRRHLSFASGNSVRRPVTPSSGHSTPIETSL